MCGVCDYDVVVGKLVEIFDVGCVGGCFFVVVECEVDLVGCECVDGNFVV